MDNEQPHQELVKCVLVGDTAVGKTRLICARACNKHVSLSQLLSTHVPTVWAIDQYRIYKDVLERSWEVVDGVNVSLRLWDTFGDHDKDRRFAYGRSDVILLCFSIASSISLRNCKLMWYPEIRRFCPDVPVILVGCKNDLRYMYRDESYLSYFGERSTFVRAALKSDLVMPDEARAVAKELGLAYYETSVFTYFGVNEVFENAIRCALIARRQQRFWMTNLKKVQKPLLQAPFRPPKPPPPDVTVLIGDYAGDMYNMLLSQAHTDVLLISDTAKFHVHKFLLAAASNVFKNLFTTDVCDMGVRSSSESSMVSSTYGEGGGGTQADFGDDTECLIRYESRTQRMWPKLKRRSSYQALPLVETQSVNDHFKELFQPIFQNIRVVQVEKRRGVVAAQTVITLTKLITPRALQQCLVYMYTGKINDKIYDLQEMKLAAELLEIHHLNKMLANHPDALNEPQSEDKLLNNHWVVKKNLEKYCFGNGLFSDVAFELDDGQMKAHKAVLVARCDVMRAMFTGDFREAHSNVIVFPGVTTYTFHKLLCYLYTDEIPEIAADKCLNLLELANRLCLPRLLNLVECRVIEDLTTISQNNTTETVGHCLKLLEPVKLHNAHQLAEWCMSYLCVNYNAICKSSLKALKTLHQENQDYLREHRWPPVWYLKDYDYYQRCINEMNKQNKSTGRDMNKKNEGSFLCFSGVYFLLLGRCKRNNKNIAGNEDEQSEIDSRVFNNPGNSMNRIDLENDPDLNL